MLEFALYLNIHCTDASDLISRLQAKDNMNEMVRVEIIEVIRESTPDCNWDAND